MTRYRVVLRGIVQGVGFRPFVKRLADRMALPGVAFNTVDGLVVEIDCGDDALAFRFVAALQSEAPRGARIENCLLERAAHQDSYSDFRILVSAALSFSPADSFTLISPDLATCADCLRDISDPGDRRFGYPFTNCTNCGPRYSITRSTPYDRGNTTMGPFPMCEACATEYCALPNRRFHAEPIACPVCGPRLSMSIADTVTLLEAGQILALKGLGGYQLACDAFRAGAVHELRVRKRRSRKPFAVMMRNLAVVDRYCEVSDTDRKLLCDKAAPVVLLPWRDHAVLASEIAPGLKQIGVMLPYTPLHHLLFQGSIECLVMTSGNVSEEPIVIANEEAQEKLSTLAHCVLTHDREIFMRVDDSVVRNFEGVPRVLRRARGYAPGAIALASEVAEVLATGGELKNTFCITKGRYAIPSQHIGDLDNYETLQFFEETFANLQSVYHSRPRLIAHDLHPDYLSTRWAQGRGAPTIAVQHHHAHIASCMAENGVTQKVIGVAFDGTGYGDDAQAWGGEFLVCDFHNYQRCAHLRYVALPGGDRAARQGWRMAAAHLYDANGARYRDEDLPCWSAVSPATWRVIDQMVQKPALRTSSCGRLFDAVSAICGISHESSYEGESAMLLEAAAALQEGEDIYAVPLAIDTMPWTIDTRPMMRQIAFEIAGGRSASAVARCFHNSIAHMIEAVCRKLRERNSVNKVCLSGGTFQNFTLLSSAAALLRIHGFQVFLHSLVPPNDGGISLGQAAIAAAFLNRTDSDVSRDSR